MSTAKLLILENQLGQKVRTFSVDSKNVNIVYLQDQRRIEAYANLDSLNRDKVNYTLIKTLQTSDVAEQAIPLEGIGAIRLQSGKIINSPVYSLAEETDQEELALILKKTTLGHLVAVLALMIGAWAFAYFAEKEEPPLVTIVLPKDESKPEPRPHVQVSEKKIQPTKKIAKIIPKNILHTKTHVVNTTKAVDVKNVGALKALGGVATGTRGYEGLDTNSTKAIRAAGVGSGGGGVGSSGAGGIKGYLPGSGFIAGSAGNGGRAQSAGGYGTRGVGGGKANYGKIHLVGGTSAVSLPLDDEATVAAGLDRDQIIAVINRNQGQIVYCYEKGLQAAPNIGGRVAVDFVIGPNGRITTARVAQSSLRSQLVESCMLDKMRNWQFPRPVGKVNVDVLYPFELTRVSSR